MKKILYIVICFMTLTLGVMSCGDGDTSIDDLIIGEWEGQGGSVSIFNRDHTFVLKNATRTQVVESGKYAISGNTLFIYGRGFHSKLTIITISPTILILGDEDGHELEEFSTHRKVK